MLFSGVVFLKVVTGAITVASSLTVLNVLLLFLSYFWELLWSYIDEQEVSRRNLWGDFLATRFGWELTWKSDSCWDYQRKSGGGCDRDFLVFLGTLLIPAATLLVVAVQLYQLTALAILLYAIVRLARYTRRFSKKLSAHTIDPDAHKVED